MNIKVTSIVASILVVFLAAMLFMQKGNYVFQAETHYKETTGKTFKQSGQILEFVNGAIEQNRLLWSLATDAVQKVQTAKEMADLESKYFPGIKGVNSIKDQTRKFSATADFYIVSSFAKVETDKSTGVKTLTKLTNISIDALLGKTSSASEEEEGEGEGEE